MNIRDSDPCVLICRFCFPNMPSTCKKVAVFSMVLSVGHVFLGTTLVLTYFLSFLVIDSEMDYMDGFPIIFEEESEEISSYEDSTGNLLNDVAGKVFKSPCFYGGLMICGATIRLAVTRYFHSSLKREGNNRKCPAVIWVAVSCITSVFLPFFVILGILLTFKFNLKYQLETKIVSFLSVDIICTLIFFTIVDVFVLDLSKKQGNTNQLRQEKKDNHARYN